MLIWSVKSTKLSLKNESFHLVSIFLKIENQSRMLIFVLMKFWNSNANFEFSFSFKLSSWVFEFVSKLFPKTISTSGPGYFFQPIAVKVWARDFGLRKILWVIHKDIFVCLFSIHNTISLSCHEHVCLSGLRFERYFSHHRAT